MKKLSLLAIVALLSATSFNVKADMNILYAPDALEWFIQPGMSVYWEDEAEGIMAFEVLDGDHDAWQAAVVTLIDVDVDKYSEITVKTIGEEGAEWNLKVSTPEDDNSISFFNKSQDGGDVTEFGDYTFNIKETREELSGECSFKIWIWVIGKRERLIMTDLYLVGEETSVKNILDFKTITNKPGGIRVNNVDSDVAVYTIDGKLVKSFTGANSSLDIDLEKGLYVVNVDGKSAKVTVF